MYGKTFASMYTGSMFGAGMNVFSVWNWVLANCTPDGLVDINPPAVAVTLGGTVAEVETALEYLAAPDEHSRSDAEDGRRLVHVQGPCFQIVNHEKYKTMRSAEDRREYQRNWAREKRRKKPLVDSPSTDVDTASTPRRHLSTKLTNTDTETDPHSDADPPLIGGAPLAPRAPAQREDVKQVWSVMNTLRKSLMPKSRGLKLTPKAAGKVAARIDESEGGATDAIAVLEHLANDCRRNPKQLEWFQAETIFRPSNYQRTLGKLGSEEMRDVTRTGLEGFSPSAARKQLDALTGPVK